MYDRTQVTYIVLLIICVVITFAGCCVAIINLADHSKNEELLENYASSSSVSTVSSCHCSAIPSESEPCNCRRCEK